MLIDPRQRLAQLFESAVSAADPNRAIRAYLPRPPKGRTIVVGAGKAASQMAAAFENVWDGPFEGTVIARHGPTAPCQRIHVVQAAHPEPDEAGLHGAAHLLNLVRNLTKDDLVIALISGGGSALLPAPPRGFVLQDEVILNRALLRSGAPIAAMNIVRAHFSQIKSGRLAAAAYPAQVISLIVSDIPGDNPAFVASGPTVPQIYTAADALDVIRDYRIELPEPIMAEIKASNAPDYRSDAFKNNTVHVIASSALSLESAAATARGFGLDVHILSDSIEGEAKDIGLMHAALAREIALKNRPFKKPVVILSGGETTVDMRDGVNGKGGRNSEFMLSFALAIDGIAGITALAADTDGIDGSELNAGVYGHHETAARLRQLGLNGREFLSNHDAYSAFERIGDLFVTGPTGTNVNDFRAILVE